MNDPIKNLSGQEIENLIQLQVGALFVGQLTCWLAYLDSDLRQAALQRIVTELGRRGITSGRLPARLIISQRSKTAKIKIFINYKREIYALAHLNLSTASFKCLS